MTVARVPANGMPRGPSTPRALNRRRFMVGIGKLVLPAIAVALLATLAVWPEISKDVENGRLSYRRLAVTPESGELAEPRYRGVDSGGRPYTITATKARQSAQSRTDLVDPKADMTQDSGTWLMVQARTGVYLPKNSQLDLSGEVTLYREDGLMVTSDAATLDLRDGAATSAARVHAEGPFGTLDAQGFAVLDKGTAMQFSGPGRLVMNGSGK
jgi:lipopolysaccharide export system protein LptC